MVAVPARKATQPGGIGSLESILGLLKVLKYRLRTTIIMVTMVVSKNIRYQSDFPHFYFIIHSSHYKPNLKQLDGAIEHKDTRI